jgi:toxin ParE1/3/4
VRVHWTDTALSHLRSIHAYIGQSSPEYALRIVDRLTRRSQQIGVFPQSGRIVPEVELPQIRKAALKHFDVGCKFRETLRRKFYTNCPPNPRFERDQHF